VGVRTGTAAVTSTAASPGSVHEPLPGIVEPPRTSYVRRSSDLLRLAVGVALLILAFAAGLATEDSAVLLQRALYEAVGRPAEVAHAVLGGATTVAVNLAFVLAVALLLVTRRYRAAGYVVLADLAAAAAGEALIRAVDRLGPDPLAVLRDQAAVGDYELRGFLAGAVAAVTAGACWLTRRWRQVVWVSLGLAGVLRLVDPTVLPGTALLEVTFGWVVGTAVLLTFGAPNPRATAAAVAEALGRVGLPVRALRRAEVDARGSMPWWAETTTGEQLFVKVWGAGERDADLLFRLYRHARFRDIADEAPFASVRRAVEHEALLGYAAADAGVNTPRLRAIAQVSVIGGGVLLAYQQLPGQSADSVEAGRITDRGLRGLWDQVGLLRTRRIAHRDLRLANVVLDKDGRTWLVDFGFGQLTAGDHALADDVAGLRAATSLLVGPDRAVAAASATLGPGALAAALPRLQPQVLSGATRTELRRHPGLLAELRRAAERASGVDEVPLERLERITPATVVGILGLGGAVYFLLPQLAHLTPALHRIRDAAPGWAAAAVGVALLGFVGSTMSLSAIVPARLPVRGVLLAQLAASFAGRLTPASAGAYAVNIRFLRHAGVPAPAAVTAVGLKSFLGFFTQSGLLVVLLVVAGSTGVGTAPRPPGAALVAAAAVVLAGGLGAAVPVGRRLVRRRLWPALLQAVGSLRQLMERPLHLLLAVAGSFLVITCQILALGASTLAFHGHLPVATLGLVVLGASAAAAAVPSPGGLGPAEAAYTAGLVIAGLDGSTAIASVLAFRLATYWLPLLPGGISFRVLRHQRRI
jgi:uncharacterized membrane protein YbhN (UPF0104 family)/tRNA A-37 threonylcarbamoyl transferase component Bud32